jgi:hypothetical protein
MPAGSATSCRERLIRLKPGLLKIDIRIKISWKILGLFHKNSQSECFCEKDKQRTMLPQANRPPGLAPGRNQRHRVSRVT